MTAPERRVAPGGGAVGDPLGGGTGALLATAGGLTLDGPGTRPGALGTGDGAVPPSEVSGLRRGRNPGLRYRLQRQPVPRRHWHQVTRRVAPTVRRKTAVPPCKARTASLTVHTPW